MTNEAIGLLGVILLVILIFGWLLEAMLSALREIRIAVNTIRIELGSLSDQLERIADTLDSIDNNTLGDELLPGDHE